MHFAKPEFVHLHLHTEHSLPDGANRMEPLAARAAQLDMCAMAMEVPRVQLLPEEGRDAHPDRPEETEQIGAKIREIASRCRGVSLSSRIAPLNDKLRGWVDYFALADTHTPFQRLDAWLRRRLRMCLWKQRKKGQTRRCELRGLGLKEEAASRIAATRNGYWRTAKTPQLHQALGNAFMDG